MINKYFIIFCIVDVIFEFVLVIFIGDFINYCFFLIVFGCWRWWRRGELVGWWWLWWRRVVRVWWRERLGIGDGGDGVVNGVVDGGGFWRKL